MSRDPKFDEYVLSIRAVLDQLDYYRLLGLDHAARLQDVKRSFYAIAARFHPDRNRDAPEEVQKAIYDIFKRLNEAYRVLGDHERRARYDAGLAEGKIRLEADSRRTLAPRSAEDTITNRDARQFFRQSLESLRQGNLSQAELHVRMAASREPGNKAIEQLAVQIREMRAARKG